ncbi:MAG TPA: DUF3300 domain-containing protein [Bryobacteraceae bacterium]|jgi:uncharacterized membrane protein YgcG
MTFGAQNWWIRTTALWCAALIAPGELPLLAQEPAAGAPEAPKLKSAEQLDSLVAPIALYPDPLLAQVLAASTYPLEIVQCARWAKDNAKLKGEELTKAAAKQSWDPSVQALVAFPDALKFLDTNIQWTQDLGNAVLDQQNDVMDAVQRMRKKAKDGGKLQTSKEQKVEVKTVEQKTVIEIQPSDPQVIYVPSYSPTVVYGAPPPAYAYPPVAYPSTGAVVATAAVSFGVGVMMGAMWGGCCGYHGYGWGCSWGGSANININNNFNTRYGYNNINNIQGGNRTNIGSGNNSWQHNPQHRRSVPYSNRNTAQRFGGADRGRDNNNRGRDNADRGRDNNNNRGRDNADRGRDNNDRGRDNSANRDRGQSGRNGAGNQDRVGNRSVGGDDRGRQSNSAFGGSQSKERTQAASNRGFSSERQSRSGGGGGFSGGQSRSSGGGGGGRSRGGGRRR